MAVKKAESKRHDAPERSEEMVREVARIVIRSHKEALKELERH